MSDPVSNGPASNGPASNGPVDNDSVGNDRRSFLKSMGVGAGVVGAAGAMGTPVLVGAASPAAAAPAAPVSPTSFHIEIDGVSGGYLSSVMGGHRVADVVEEADENGVVRKHIGGVKFEDITMLVGPGTRPALTDQIAAMVSGTQRPIDGAVSAVTSKFMEHSRLTFENALITEIVVPALDGAAKEAAYLKVTLQPESTTFRHRHEKIERPINAKQQKKWLTSNFKLEIDGLDCRKVTKIESFTIKQKIVEVGDVATTVQKEPAKLEFPNITIHLVDDPASHEFYDWFDSALDAPDGDERQGTLTFYAQDQRTVLGTLSFTHLGPVRVAHDDTPTGEGIRRVKAEMYCEEIAIKASGFWS